MKKYKTEKPERKSIEHDKVEPVSLKNAPIDTRWERAILILSLVIPTSLCQMVNILVEVMNLIFIGHLNDASMLAGVGMGNMTQNLCGLSIILGFNSTIDTLVSQSAGTGEIKMCGVYLNRGRFVMTVIFVPILFIIMNTENMLIFIGQDPIVSKHAQTYVMAFLPGLYIQGLADL
jgi:MATE family multidrug resistance protein